MKRSSNKKNIIRALNKALCLSAVLLAALLVFALQANAAPYRETTAVILPDGSLEQTAQTAPISPKSGSALRGESPEPLRTVPGTIFETVEATTFEDAAAALREAMKNREENIVVRYASTTQINGSFPQMLFDEAVKHTGVPDEGDYIFRHHTSRSLGTFTGTKENNVYHYRIPFSFTFYTTAAQEAELTAGLNALMPEILEGKTTDLEKATAVYDWICENISYDYSTGDDKIFTAYAAWKDRMAVCQGYTNLLYRMLLMAGVDCRFIPGAAIMSTSQENHSWNICKIDGKWYNLDATWDATVKQTGGGAYRFFLRGSYSFDSRHGREEEWASEPFISLYPVEKEDYFPTVLTADSPIDCAEFFIDMPDGSVLTLADCKNKNFLLVYAYIGDENTRAFLQFLRRNQASLDAAGISVVAAFANEMSDIEAYGQSFPDFTFGKWNTDNDFAVGNMLTSLESNFSGSVTYPIVFLINDNRECVFHTMGYINETEQLIPTFSDFCKLRATVRDYTIYQHCDCPDFTFYRTDNTTLQKSDVLGSKAIFVFSVYTDAYTKYILGGFDRYSGFMKSRGINVYPVLLDYPGDPLPATGFMEYAASFPNFEVVKENSYSMWDFIETFDPNVQYISYPVVMLLHPNGELIRMNAGDLNVFDLLDWFSVTSEAGHEHTPGTTVMENVTAPTCTEDGGYDEVVYCTDCGAEISRTHVTVPATGHLWSSGTQVLAPTCETAGMEFFMCMRDTSHTRLDPIPALGHDLEHIDASAPTCIASGNAEHWHCKRCGKLFSDAAGSVETTEAAVTIPADGIHTPGAPVSENEIPATATTDGSYDEVVYCTVCGSELQRQPHIIPATGDPNAVTGKVGGVHYSYHTVTRELTFTGTLQPGEKAYAAVYNENGKLIGIKAFVPDDGGMTVSSDGKILRFFILEQDVLPGYLETLTLPDAA
ncbi:MAG: transglutaminase domain-containing protein [Clostridia bacterium]|nr:transglutaminase domain-containing protein [Clostridia bacterium]